MNDQFIHGVIFDWDRIDNDSYLKRIEAFKGVEKLDFNKAITFFVGENGSGKSTLLEALAVAHGFNPEGGTKNYIFSTHDTHSELCDAIIFYSFQAFLSTSETLSFCYVIHESCFYISKQQVFLW